jgi:hypothetical protein
MVISRFVFAGLASGNDARPLVALRVTNHQDSAQAVHAKGDKSLFAYRVWIFDRHGEGIPQSLLSMGKADAVLGEVAGRFGRIKLEFHAMIMHNLCINYAYLSYL